MRSALAGIITASLLSIPSVDTKTARGPDTTYVGMYEHVMIRAKQPYTPPEPEAKYSDEHIPILMFHNIGPEPDRYTLTPRQFDSVLTELDAQNYSCVTLTQYLNSNFESVPHGRKPILLTFDDASDNQFTLQNGQPDSTSAVGILEQHFDDEFGRGAVFYVSNAGDDHRYRSPFHSEIAPRQDVETHLSWLEQHGYDIGYHTPQHHDQTHATHHDVMRDHRILTQLLSFEATYPSRDYAHPFGARPTNKDAKNAMKQVYRSTMHAWGGLAPHPKNPAFSPYDIPRIETHVETVDWLRQQDVYVHSDSTSL